MIASGTTQTFGHVRGEVRFGREAENICSFRVLPFMTHSCQSTVNFVVAQMSLIMWQRVVVGLWEAR
jgi:hypothetical protein